jgi:aspartokinase
MRRAWELLREADIPLRELSIHGTGSSFVVPLANVPDWPRARAIMERDPAFKGAELRSDVAVVSVVGAGLTDTTEPLVRMLDALGGAGIEPIEVRASPLRLRAIIDKAAAAEAQRALHERFVSAAS